MHQENWTGNTLRTAACWQNQSHAQRNRHRTYQNAGVVAGGAAALVQLLLQLLGLCTRQTTTTKMRRMLSLSTRPLANPIHDRKLQQGRQTDLRARLRRRKLGVSEAICQRPLRLLGPLVLGPLAPPVRTLLSKSQEWGKNEQEKRDRSSERKRVERSASEGGESSGARKLRRKERTSSSCRCSAATASSDCSSCRACDARSWITQKKRTRAAERTPIKPVPFKPQKHVRSRRGGSRTRADNKHSAAQRTDRSAASCERSSEARCPAPPRSVCVRARMATN